MSGLNFQDGPELAQVDCAHIFSPIRVSEYVHLILLKCDLSLQSKERELNIQCYHMQKSPSIKS